MTTNNCKYESLRVDYRLSMTSNDNFLLLFVIAIIIVVVVVLVIVDVNPILYILKKGKTFFIMLVFFIFCIALMHKAIRP